MALPPLIPIEDLFAPPERSGAQISADGTRIAFLAPWKDRMNVWVQELGADGRPEGEPRCVTADETRSVQHYELTPDPRWLLYLQDDGGDENHHLFRIDLDDPGAAAVDLTPFPGARVLSHKLSHRRPGAVLMEINARNPAELDLVELDIATGAITVLAENPGDVLGWIAADDGAPLAISQDGDGSMPLYRWDRGPADPIAVFSGADYPLGVYPMEPTADGSGLLIGSHTGSDRMRLARVDLATGEESEVDSHPEHDLDAIRRGVAMMGSPLIRNPATGALLGARYYGQRQVVRALDPGFGAVLEKLESLSEGDIGALSCDRAARRWVVSYEHDRDPHVTWLYDHATGEAHRLFRARPRLDPASLAPKHPVSFPARDGLDLTGYLTLPPGAEPADLPTVLLVHGGPWYRESWSFGPEVQLLANRGYAVLQVDFRGSVGHGRAHMRAAIGELAGAMHDDLLDAADWAVEQGYADPDRIAVFGGSYGGYAALVGAAFTPERFAAAVDYVGISDLENFMRSLPPFARKGLVNNWYRYGGNPDIAEQAADLRARSPIHRVDAVRIPLLIVQGANDVRVVRAESDNMVAALRARGVEVEYLVKDDEGHGFVNPENVMDFYRAAAGFLARHLGGRPEPE
ncbi:S9 family peptidase [Nocardiopsis coralliicola]